MSVRDVFHGAVKRGLEKEQWRISSDPLELRWEEIKVKIDLAAERLIAAERGEEKIAVEIKSFISPSPISDFHVALGQFLNYRIMLEAKEPDRELYLAVPLETYETFFQSRLAQTAIERHRLKIIVYKPNYRGNSAMDKLDRYRTLVQKLLEQHQFVTRDEEVDNELFFDTTRDHYQLMYVGWNGLSRIYHTVLHFDIKDGKIWLQQNTTDSDVGQELIDMGVPKEDIVLGLHPAYKRPYTGYGVAN